LQLIWCSDGLLIERFKAGKIVIFYIVIFINILKAMAVSNEVRIIMAARLILYEEN
jgi:hypothetical protein